MKLSNPFARRLSLRIWLTEVVGMAVLTLAVGWAWRVSVEENSLNQPTAPGREMVLRGPDGQPVVRGYALREPGPPGEGINFRIQTDTGEKYTMELGPKPRAKTVGKSAAASAGATACSRPAALPMAGPTARWPSGCARPLALCGCWASWVWRSPWACTRSSGG